MASSFADQFSNLKNSELFPLASSTEIEKNDKTDESTTVNKASKPLPSKSQNSILVSPKQKGNPLLKAITAVPWEYDESIIPDYVMGKTTCALFLSLKYHNLKPDYINERLKQLGKMYELRVLLVQVDLADPHHALKHLVRVCLLCDLTLMLAWNAHEAGKIIETYKVYENKPADLIMERQEGELKLQVMNALSSIRSVNRTDAATLLSTFGSINNVVRASKESIALCPGIGLQKATRLQNVLKQPFLKSKSAKTSSQQKEITNFLKKT